MAENEYLDFSDLENLDDLKPDADDSSREKFPCERCAGTGHYQGHRVHQEQEQCFQCKGKGYFYTSYKDRRKRREQTRTRKVNKLQKTRKGFEASNPGMTEFLTGASSWSEFAASLTEAIIKYGALTDNQLKAAKKMRAKVEARAETKRQERQADTAKVDTTAPMLAILSEAFLSAADNLKWPKLRLKTSAGERVVLSRCGENSKTPGHINITDGGRYGENRYYGRISPDGRAYLRRETPGDVVEVLTDFNADPQGAIKMQGQRTGECCCCGRELTDPESIAAGIGPICIQRWGF